MATFSDVETSVRASVDQPDTGRTPQATILALANEEYDEVVKRLAGQFSDWYRSVSADLTIAATSSPYIDISSLTTAFRILKVQRLFGTRYLRVDPADDNPDNAPKLTWQQRGFWGSGAKIDIYPAMSSVGTYRVQYCAHPGALTSGSTELKLPLGGVKYLAACVAARLREREEEDPNYMVSVREGAFASLIRDLAPVGGTIGTGGRY